MLFPPLFPICSATQVEALADLDLRKTLSGAADSWSRGYILREVSGHDDGPEKKVMVFEF